MNAAEILSDIGIKNHRVLEGIKKGNKDEFLKGFGGQNAKEKAEAVASILNVAFNKKQKKEAKGFRAHPERRMIGKSNYDIPDLETLRDSYEQIQTAVRMKHIRKLAKDTSEMVGQITLETYDQKILSGEKQKLDPVKEYIKRFSEAQHVFQEYGHGKNVAG